jgi:hypothetical protein
MLRAKEAVYGYSVSLGAVDEAWKVRGSSVDEGLTPTMAEREQPQLLLVSTAHRLRDGADARPPPGRARRPGGRRRGSTDRVVGARWREPSMTAPGGGKRRRTGRRAERLIAKRHEAMLRR